MVTVAVRVISLVSLVMLVAGCGAKGRKETQALKPALPDSGALRITYACNAGFIVSISGKKILIDALFEDSGGICRSDSYETARDAGPPFDGADLVLVSHDHWDHFDPRIMGDYLVDNTEAVLIADISAADALAREFDAFDRIRDRVRGLRPPEGQTVRIELDGITVEALSAPADVPNLGFLIRVGGTTLFHSGDANLDAQTAPYFGSYGLREKAIDIAFIPYWYLIDDQGRSSLNSGIGAGDYIPMHYAGEYLEYVFTAVRRGYHNAILFSSEMQTWTRAADTKAGSGTRHSFIAPSRENRSSCVFVKGRPRERLSSIPLPRRD